MRKHDFLTTDWFNTVATLLPARVIADTNIEMSVSVLAVAAPAGVNSRSAMYVSAGRVEWTTDIPDTPDFSVTIPYSVLRDTWAGIGLAAAADAYVKGLIKVTGDMQRFDTLNEVMSLVFSGINDGAANIRELTA
jgi:hypothetical protein